jgi:ribosomal-protein-alanine N-acetyltransferase
MLATEEKQEICARIRWMIKRDAPEVLDIETASFEFPWQDYEFAECLHPRNHIGMVAGYEDKVIGFMIYELYGDGIHILNFAVHPDWRRQGVGKQIVSKLIAKLSARRFKEIVLEVRETNLPAQLFFRECGFKAIDILHEYYEDTPEDAYLMLYRYRLKSPNKIEKPKSLLTRIISRLAS